MFGLGIDTDTVGSSLVIETDKVFGSVDRLRHRNLLVCSGELDIYQCGQTSKKGVVLNLRLSRFGSVRDFPSRRSNGDC